MDRYNHESSKSYKECEILNNAHQSLLERTTLGLELERKKTTLYLSREEHHLREQLRQMQIAKARNDLAHSTKEIKIERTTTPVEIVKKIPTEPYPVTFSISNTPSPVEHGKHLEKYGRLHGYRRRRKLSKEFEDVSLETGSRSLLSFEEPAWHRRRVNSMTAGQKPDWTMLPKQSLRRRTILNAKNNKGGNSSSSSKESLNNNDSTASLENIY